MAEHKPNIETAGAVETPQRRPFIGSCHCGAVRYVVFLTVPPRTLIDANPTPRRGVQQIYKCNCTICHKAGFFHVRPAHLAEDFFLLSPLDPHQDLGDYLCNDGFLHFLFCKTCGVRCFIHMGEGESIDVDVSTLGLPGDASGTTKAWKPKESGASSKDPNGSYLSVNAHTIEAGQDGFDLREWVERKCVNYLDCLGEKGSRTHERPHAGGTY